MLLVTLRRQELPAPSVQLRWKSDVAYSYESDVLHPVVALHLTHAFQQG